MVTNSPCYKGLQGKLLNDSTPPGGNGLLASCPAPDLSYSLCSDCGAWPTNSSFPGLENIQETRQFGQGDSGLVSNFSHLTEKKKPVFHLSNGDMKLDRPWLPLWECLQSGTQAPSRPQLPCCHHTAPLRFPGGSPRSP